MPMFVDHSLKNLCNLPKKSFNYLEDGGCYLRFNNRDELVLVDHIKEIGFDKFSDGVHSYDKYGDPFLSGHTIKWEIDISRLKDSIWKNGEVFYTLLDICDVKSLFNNGTATPTWMVVLEGYHPIPFVDLLKDFELVKYGDTLL